MFLRNLLCNQLSYVRSVRVDSKLGQLGYFINHILIHMFKLAFVGVFLYTEVPFLHWNLRIGWHGHVLKLVSLQLHLFDDFKVTRRASARKQNRDQYEGVCYTKAYYTQPYLKEYLKEVGLFVVAHNKDGQQRRYAAMENARAYPAQSHADLP